jgi:hypothetical protein
MVASKTKQMIALIQIRVPRLSIWWESVRSTAYPDTVKAKRKLPLQSNTSLIVQPTFGHYWEISIYLDIDIKTEFSPELYSDFENQLAALYRWRNLQRETDFHYVTTDHSIMISTSSCLRPHRLFVGGWVNLLMVFLRHVSQILN